MMPFTDLTAEEQLVFFGLAKQLVRADRHFSEEEGRVIAALQGEIGPELFRARLAAASVRFKRQADVLRSAMGVVRPDAREVIYERLYALAEADGVDASERGVVSRLREMWRD